MGPLVPYPNPTGPLGAFRHCSPSFLALIFLTSIFLASIFLALIFLTMETHSVNFTPEIIRAGLNGRKSFGRKWLFWGNRLKIEMRHSVETSLASLEHCYKPPRNDQQYWRKGWAKVCDRREHRATWMPHFQKMRHSVKKVILDQMIFDRLTLHQIILCFKKR